MGCNLSTSADPPTPEDGYLRRTDPPEQTPHERHIWEARRDRWRQFPLSIELTRMGMVDPVTPTTIDEEVVERDPSLYAVDGVTYYCGPPIEVGRGKKPLPSDVEMDNLRARLDALVRVMPPDMRQDMLIRLRMFSNSIYSDDVEAKLLRDILENFVPVSDDTDGDYIDEERRPTTPPPAYAEAVLESAR